MMGPDLFARHTSSFGVPGSSSELVAAKGSGSTEELSTVGGKSSVEAGRLPVVGGAPVVGRPPGVGVAPAVGS